MSGKAFGFARPFSNENTPLVAAPSPQTQHRRLFRCSLAVLGPGLLVSLADTDAACLLEAADSGARYGYSGLMGLQVLLCPVLFMAQELTVRLGTHTRQGHCACIRQHYGMAWTWVTTFLLLVSCVLAIVSELAGIAGVCGMYGVPASAGACLAAALLIALVCAAPYRMVELTGLTFGVFELAFFVSWALARPANDELFGSLFRFEGRPDFLFAAAANMGAVIMPWMIYFQQSAVAAQRLRATASASTRETTELTEAAERTGTLLGAIVTQLVMLATMITFAATRSATRVRSIEDVASMHKAFAIAFGDASGKALLACGIFGGSVCATIVVASAASWALCDALAKPPVRRDGGKASCEASSSGDAGGNPPELPKKALFVEAAVVHDPESNPMDLPLWRAPAFYACYAGTVVAGLLALLVGASQRQVSLVALISNAALVPITLAFLWLLATNGRVLPDGARVTGGYKWLSAGVFSLASIFSMVGVASGLGMA